MMAKKTKQQKRKARRKAFERDRNIAKNQPKCLYRIDVCWPEGWKTMGGFHNMAQVEKYVAEQESIRERNESDILEGRIVEIDTGKLVAHIPASKKQQLPEGIEVVKDIEPKGYVGDVKEI
jgi:hypothetical protein